ncbi:sugar ABC transporter ATP-binding protein [Geodermatophilus sp. CPCC 205506]|uniref:sugar ABC transporter ATP-binding protein n=1 Tax=Geodermatophilus sp. CPCC 205506 TaxID=2936596 RepID=UPI003EEA36EB
MSRPSSNPVEAPGLTAEHSGRQEPAVLDLRGLAKSFDDKTVLHPFELQIGPGEVHALLGQNGSGKSTLIKLLSGYHQPDPGGEGWVGGESLTFGSPDASRRLGLRFVHQDLGLVGKNTVLDNFFFGRGFPRRFGTILQGAAERECAAALSAVGLDVSPGAQVSSLSPAQRTGVAVARALHAGGTPARVLVLDEPTATLPTEEVEHLHTMLRSAAAGGVAILYVTHFLDEVYALAQRVSVLRDGHLVLTSPVSQVSRRQLVHELVGGELETVHQAIAQDSESADSRGGKVLSVQDLHGQSLRGVDLEAAAGDVVGVYGLTGSGREALLGAVFGSLPRESGRVEVAGRPLPPLRPDRSIAAGVGYLPPDRKTTGGFMQLTATDNLTLVDLAPFWSRGVLRRKAESTEAAGWFDRLQVRPPRALNAPLSSFSGGNQQKILFAKWLRMQPDVLLLDDPTQGVDVGAKAVLHRQIITERERGAAVVISSTDVEELASLCDRVLIMHEGRVAQVLDGPDVTEAGINRASHRVDSANRKDADS